MNQILFYNNSTKKMKIFIYKIIFLFSLLIINISIILLVSSSIQIKKEKNFSSFITKNYDLYSIYPEIFVPNNSIIIGHIEIEKLYIKYPIFSYYSKDLLKIAPCRLIGPLPNYVGNLCIIAHNYNNNTFFSNLSNLSNNDLIKIYDIYGNCFNYHVYNHYETENTDTNCISQNTNGKSELTLITCTNFQNRRLIIKAKK